ncbi:MAG: 1-acyl-sn-glycerol-3-phosphate acyltransferase [Balneolaceae bacterium]|nr:1-acyl-sn-glycerol-3-phosphate acyltransferase [Balneolaceae bacterium]
MRVLFSIFTWLYFSLLFLLFFIIISIVFLFTFLFDKYRKVPNFTLSIMARLMMKASPGWNIHIEGVEKFNRSKSTIFIANHQSFLDMALIYHLPWKMKWVSKKSLTYIPVMGWLVWLTGHLTINRKSRSALKKLNNLVQPLNDLVPVMIFPEGTRSTNGEIKSFKNGAFLLSKEYGYTIQPMIIDGGHKAMRSGAKILNPKADFKVEILDAIEPGNFESMRALKDHCNDLMKSKLNEIRPH